jgi:hypothetical protein
LSNNLAGLLMRIPDVQVKATLYKLLRDDSIINVRTYEDISKCFQAIFLIELHLGYGDEEILRLADNLKKTINMFGTHYKQWLGEASTREMYQEFERLQRDHTTLVEVLKENLSDKSLVKVMAEWEKRTSADYPKPT